MSLHRQIAILLIALTIALIAGTYAVQTLVVMPTFAELERQWASRDVERCIDAIQRDIESISNVANDWGSWDDSYEYVQNRNESFAKGNLIDESFSNTRLNLICLLDVNRNIIWGEVRDMKSLTQIPVPDLMSALQEPANPITNHRKVDDVVQGVLLTSLRSAAAGFAADHEHHPHCADSRLHRHGTVLEGQ